MNLLILLGTQAWLARCCRLLPSNYFGSHWLLSWDRGALFAFTAGGDVANLGFGGRITTAKSVESAGNQFLLGLFDDGTVDVALGRTTFQLLALIDHYGQFRAGTSDVTSHWSLIVTYLRCLVGVIWRYARLLRLHVMMGVLSRCLRGTTILCLITNSPTLLWMPHRRRRLLIGVTKSSKTLILTSIGCP